MSKNDDFQFETAFARLELILDKMNSGKSSLDESIKLYEEADKLIAICSKQLTSVETRIETLIKKRDGSVATEPLEPQVQEV